MTVMRYVFLWILSFVFTSAVDALWHLVLFRRAYTEGMKPVARMSGDKMALKAFPGLVSQILVVTCIVLLVLYKTNGGSFLGAVFIGSLAGILAISVYGVTNYSLLKNWGLSITILEVVWGPILGCLSGAFVFGMRSILLK